ncbi:coenzyme F420 hydrogenase family / dehydrogenase, beta subunit family [Prunus dulcis]|uniref:Coenzyme F420 hydrogenase family / dehydrogenase, beta subunit family n=1 Tax=Prunus dulcis TaxID=3755 RepID=A0A4Y1QL46_PRUDU|nr:coenzyme F420 hydrogenase family / dehydrogenase, beta subunit family [Prunus dulcis]
MTCFDLQMFSVTLSAENSHMSLTHLFQDLVVGYMGVPKYSGISMTQHPQNERGREMLSLVDNLLKVTPTTSRKGPEPAPKFVGNVIAFLLNLIGPKGLEFARYSLDYHTIRNYLADQHMPSYAKKIVDTYNKNGEINRILSNK